MLADPLEITAADIPGHVPEKPVDPTQEIQNKVAPRVAEARLLKVTDQATLDIVGERLAINKALQKESISVFKPIKQKIDATKAEVLSQEKKVMEPLQLEEVILKSITQVFLDEQRKLAEERARVERIAREAEERRLFQIAEAEAAERTRIENERIRREHEAEVERAFESMPADTPDEVLEEIANTPPPAPIRIEAEIPVLPNVKSAPYYVLPRGMANPRGHEAEVTSFTMLCAAIGRGEVPSSYADPNMSNLNKRAMADGMSMNIPGVKVKPKSGISQRSR